MSILIDKIIDLKIHLQNYKTKINKFNLNLMKLQRKFYLQKENLMNIELKQDKQNIIE